VSIINKSALTLVAPVALSAMLSTSASAATLTPDLTLSSALTVQIEQVAKVDPANLASPVSIGDDLYVIDQTGSVKRQTPTGFEEVFDPSNIPSSINLSSNSAVLNIAGEGFDVVVRYDRASDGSFSNPLPLTAFESTTTPGGHVGGGLLVLPDGTLAFARGDSTGFRADGLNAPQDNSETVGKILLIDGMTGTTTVAASGVRNPQRLTFLDDTKTSIVFADIGASTAEEINVISVADLTDTTSVENFGWGRNADGNAREGTFYINDGNVHQSQKPALFNLSLSSGAKTSQGFLP